jgi:Bacterial Ig-like domain (group 2)
MFALARAKRDIAFESGDRIKFVHRLPSISLIALAVTILLAVQGCGQFFPGGNTITALAVAPQNASVQPGVTQQFTATATYGNNTTADVTSQVTWSTTPTNIATISGAGLLTAGALGTAQVKAQSGSVIASTGVTVIQKQVTSISISPPNPTPLSLSLGPTTVQFTATATYGDGSTADVTSIATWTSVPTSTATISATGSVTAVAVGNANITATSGGVTSNTATVTVVQ